MEPETPWHETVRLMMEIEEREQRISTIRKACVHNIKNIVVLDARTGWGWGYCCTRCGTYIRKESTWTEEEAKAFSVPPAQRNLYVRLDSSKVKLEGIDLFLFSQLC